MEFGDGRHGARLPSGTENVTARYRIGGGRAGNVAAGRISQVVSRPLGVSGVTNPLAASGGADADGPAEMRQAIPLRLAAFDRLVSVRDYQSFARAFAGVGKAVASRCLDGNRPVLHVTVAAADDAPLDPSSPLLAALGTALRQYGDPTMPVRVEPCDRVRLVLVLGVRTVPGQLPEKVERRVREALADRLGFSGAYLGQPVYRSAVVAAAHAVPGVDFVHVDAFGGVSESADADDVVRFAEHPSVVSCVPALPIGLRTVRAPSLSDGTAGTRPPEAGHRRRCLAGPDGPARPRGRRGPEGAGRRGRAAPGPAPRPAGPVGPGRARDPDPAEDSMTPDELYSLLPAVHRRRDAEQGGPLRALLTIVAEQAAVVEEDIERLYDNWFIETCDDWVVPYIGDLVGYEILPGFAAALSDDTSRAVGLPAAAVPRRDVADTVVNRRRKGTLALLEDLASNVAGWPARVVEYRRLLCVTQPVRRYTSDGHDARRRSARGGLVDVRRAGTLDRLGGPFDELARTVEVPRAGPPAAPAGTASSPSACTCGGCARTP